MAEASVFVPVKRLTGFVIDVLSAVGVPAADAEIIADVLIASDLIGVRSHGIAHLKWYCDRIKAGLQCAVTRWTVCNETATTAVIDGGNGMGMVVGHHAMKLALGKARQYGLGAVAVRNSSHYGIAGYYAGMAAKEEMIGIAVTNAHPSIAPTFGTEPMLGTNPIAFCAPTDEAFDFSFDAATSIAPRGKLEVAARAGVAIPEGWVIGEDGTPVTDSRDLTALMDRKKVALLPLGGSGELMGGHKGYGLATLVEILSSALQEGAFLSGLHDYDEAGNPHALGIGHFFLAINIAHFLPVERFRKTAGDIVRELRASRKVPGQERIYTAGEKEYYIKQRVTREGVEIPPAVQKNLRQLCAELKIAGHDLGF